MGTKEPEHWQCRACTTSSVQDRLLGVVADGTEVYRLTCEGCGAISHYDRKVGQKKPIMRPSETFLWISEAEQTS